MVDSNHCCPLTGCWEDGLEQRHSQNAVPPLAVEGIGAAGHKSGVIRTDLKLFVAL